MDQPSRRKLNGPRGFGNRIEELSQSIRTIDEDASFGLTEHLNDLTGLLSSDAGLVYGLERRPDGSFDVDLFEVAKIPFGPSRKICTDLFASYRPGHTQYDPYCPEPHRRNRAESIAREVGRGALRALPSSRQGFAHLGMAGYDQLRVLVCEGSSLLAWVGVVRDAPFEDHEIEALTHLTPALHSRLRLHRRTLDDALARSALSAALEALQVEAFVLSSRGTVRHANTAGVGALDTEGTKTRESLQLALSGLSTEFETRMCTAR